jgi:hypothetical protein
MADSSSTAPKKPWIDSFLGKIGEQLEDLTYVEIVTAIAMSPGIKIDAGADNIINELNKAEAGILARTKITLGGDTVLILPTDPQGGAKIYTEVMDIHKVNTAVAIENWRNFLNMIIDLVNKLVALTGLESKDLLTKFST